MSTRIIILAAGKGKRMGSDIPKPLVEIAGRPMVRHLLDSVADSEIDERPIIVVAPDNLTQFNEICSDRDCDYTVQDEQLGTGHAVMSARDAASTAENILVLYGDHPFISAETIHELNDLHESEDSMISMITTKVPNFKGKYKNFERWGRIIRDDTHRIIAIREAKDATEEELAITEINPALFAFNAEWLWEHLPEIKNKNASKEYYLTDLIEIAIEEGHDIVTATAEPFEVVGVNTREELEAAEELLG
ncbi:hypothetical protein CO057_04690 [Candidatus Uhrbacteria bacterium CG_4_9_14_0_2_um_filter_41_50]|uniref:MobA-like NTP transferase domain-containing protein n=1 Tax=Candidatus Uhrbacteria bacterium CG_4_9_14_0_2_um_filter_41_50 TaxID=1975031 RepID=A0A2M8EMZ9_9BACT|nr:MAG: hypothetical protein COZ45_01465 [Candidatus Uhrbacteria bacterium CG_4_10_14_3_um_filter_41_21]PIZ55257.1 MAG: hypothetical protein COY24_01015 [Candidatus Uhrbacteria bacterium CG_4_10_14_0_2_um_filter_41_21]PJB84276.1 MAG: hypothetical protein CO086_04480 [Candidatus Uhrbacteria bacterium CG_4_9_14_0_8_um_filter_41_16]PJC24091.1 MAG: hypothetical protein CO057_04690 [Candidatus Uhrbacteria bacterium CG_4_9_14_0_2_um_filter_41_50]PJE74822.1 MAG: hypothetical protein COV03_03415 [Candi